jgi:hypothetical protein
MTHTVKDVDGLKVLVVTDMDRRYDEDGNLKSSKAVDLELVHAKEIARHYAIPFRDVGMGDNRVRGVWSMVFENEIGQRVPYNNEEQVPGDRNVRQFKIVRDAAGNPIDTEERIVRATRHHESSGNLTAIPLMMDTDDGMYVKLADLQEFASANGWRKGAGRPGKEASAIATSNTDQKLDKLADLVASLAQIMAQQVVVSSTGKK